MQNFISSTRDAADKQWIHDLIAKSKGLPSNNKEPIILNCDAWFMCHNILPRDHHTTLQSSKDECVTSAAVTKVISHANQDVPKRDKYEKEPRYLVIFKDEKLYTLRDLRAQHTNVLQHMQESVAEFLQHQHPTTYHLYRIYFHYLPLFRIFF